MTTKKQEVVATETVRSVRIWEIGSIMRGLADALAECEVSIDTLKDLSVQWEREQRTKRTDAKKAAEEFIEQVNPYTQEIKDFEDATTAGLTAAFDACSEEFDRKINSLGLIRQEAIMAQDIYKAQSLAYERRARREDARKSRIDSIAKYALLAAANGGEPRIVRGAENFSKVALEKYSVQAPLHFPNPENPCEDLPAHLIKRTIKVSGSIDLLSVDPSSLPRRLLALQDMGLTVEVVDTPELDDIRKLVEARDEAHAQSLVSGALAGIPSRDVLEDAQRALRKAINELGGVDVRLGERPLRVAWRQ